MYSLSPSFSCHSFHLILITCSLDSIVRISRSIVITDINYSHQHRFHATLPQDHFNQKTSGHICSYLKVEIKVGNIKLIIWNEGQETKRREGQESWNAFGRHLLEREHLINSLANGQQCKVCQELPYQRYVLGNLIQMQKVMQI